MESETIRIIIVDDLEETRNYLASLLRLESDIEVVGKFDNGKEALSAIPRLRPDVILLDTEMPEMDGYAVAEKLLAETPETQIIFLLSENDPESIRRSMRIGARDYLLKPCSIDELAYSIRRVRGSSQVTPLFEPPAPAPIASRTTSGNLIAVYSPSGGVGVSTVAVNLAIALRKATGTRVLLVDANEQFGDLGLLTKLHSPHSIAELADKELDRELLDQVLQMHSSGVRVLLAPAMPEWRPDLTTERMQQILGTLSAMSDYVVCDAGHGASDSTRAVLDNAARIVLVTTEDIAAQKNTKVFLTLAQTLGYEDKILLVLNRQAKKDKSSPSDVELNLGHPIAAVLPDDASLNATSRLTGEPFMQAHPKNPLSRAVSSLAEQFTKSEDALKPSEPDLKSPEKTEKTGPAAKSGFLRKPWTRVAAVAITGLAIVLFLFGGLPLLKISQTPPVEASVAVGKASAIPIGNGVQDNVGIQATVLSVQRRANSTALQAPVGQDALLVSMRFINTRSSGLALTLKPGDFLLVSSQGAGRAPTLGFLSKAAQTLSTVDLVAGKTYEYDIIWYVPSDSNDYWLAWKSSDGTTRLFGLTPAH
jgi:pilus assembly protein CpaE